jgi:uncharacterized surface protein with fasciclin (FAS1) repeats
MRKSLNYKGPMGVIALIMGISLASCNKDVPAPTPIEFPVPSGTSIGTIINTDPNFSLLKSAATKAGIMPVLLDSSRSLTLFAPDNAAFAASGISSGIIDALPAAQLGAILQYHLVSQKVPVANIPSTFPNFQYPSFLNPAPSVSALLRLTNFPTTRNGAWINNIPIKAVDKPASNGVIHTVAAIVAPPSKFLWNRIADDSELSYLEAAIIRADSGVAPTSSSSLIGALNNIGANLTIFAPTDAAFQATLTGAIYQALVAQGMPPADALVLAQQLASTPDVFKNPALFPVLTAQTVKGIVVYHILVSRAFSNNFPTTQTLYKTLLNSAVALHPGIALQATFGIPFVNAATVKGLANATAANILINPTPEPNGTSDQHYLNGVIHKINQVLLPQ